MVNQLITVQATIGKDLFNLLTNFKKQSKVSLEKIELILNYAANANRLFKSFDENHERLLTDYDSQKGYKYFTDDYYNIVQEEYVKLKSLITYKLAPFGLEYPPIEKPSRLLDEPGPSGVNVQKNVDENVEVESIHDSILNDDQLKNTGQNDHFEEINDTIIHSRFTSTPMANKNLDDDNDAGKKMCASILLFGTELNKMENFSLSGFKTRVKIAIPFLHTTYQRISDDLNGLIVNNAIVGVEAENCKLQFDELQERFFDLLAIADKNKDEQCIKPVALQLKPIQIPPFNGKDYADWPTFSQLFTSLIIENESLSDIQKMQYLKTGVSDEAARVIANLHITSEHFQLAWNLLNTKYNNARVIAAMRIEKLIGQPKIIAESAAALKQLHDVSRECLGLLKDISAEQIILFVLTKKLDEETHKLYEQQLTNPKEEQKLDDFLEFVEKRYRVLEAVDE